LGYDPQFCIQGGLGGRYLYSSVKSQRRQAMLLIK